MNYQLHYDRLINRARNRILSGYKERHHVIPRCLGGDNSPMNLVALTPEEHYLAHQLLVKIYPKSRTLIHAAAWMSYRVENNKLYGWIKRRRAEVLKAQTFSQATLMKMSATRLGKKLPPFSAEHRANMSKAMRGIKRSPEARENMARARIGNKNRLGIPHSPEVKARMSATRTGRKLTKEQCEAKSKRLMGHIVSQETRDKIAAALLGRPAIRSPEGIARIAEAARRRMLSDANPMKSKRGK